jgi:membrane protein required for colicin V production
LNWLDIVIAIILIVAILLGLKAGLIKTVLSFIGLILGIFLAGRFYLSLAGLFSFLPDAAARVVSYVLIIIVVMIIIALIAWILDKFISAILLGWLNHLGGAVFGLFLGGLFCGGVLAIWVKYVGGGDTVNGSFLGRFLVNSFPLVLALLPGEFSTIRSFFQ